MNEELYIDILRRLRDVVRKKRQKNGEPKLGFNYTTMLQHTGRFGQGFLSLEQYDNAGASPRTFLPWLQLIFTTSYE